MYVMRMHVALTGSRKNTLFEMSTFIHDIKKKCFFFTFIVLLIVTKIHLLCVDL